jgi:polyferredoxin
MYEFLLEFINQLIYVPEEGMVHPGLPANWILVIFISMIIIALRYTFFLSLSSASTNKKPFSYSIFNPAVKFIVTRPWILVSLRLVAAIIFLIVIYAGLFGTPIPEKNIATVLTWTLWWSGVVISIFFVGSAWCAICPWDAIATWLVRRKLWKRGDETSSLNLRVPKILRSVWPALLMFVGLTWLELGVGVTVSPYATALMALLMVVLATISLAVYERKAFCRYFCAVGRTIGAYSSIVPIALAPVNEKTCEDCTTLECYHGTDSIEPCPTHLVMGRISQNTYCTSCGACSMSCPHENVSWKIRGLGDEITDASRSTALRGRVDEAWFILGLVALTIFHGITMMPYWEGSIQKLAYAIGDSGQLLMSFTAGMFVSMLIPVILFMATIKLTQWLMAAKEEYNRIFSAFALSLLPLAFTYHIAHNLTHLVRESTGFWNVAFNPLGINALPLGMHELHMRHMNPLIADDIVFALQGVLVIFGFWLALRIARERFYQVKNNSHVNLVAFMPLVIFISVISFIDLWLLMQPMIMRM